MRPSSSHNRPSYFICSLSYSAESNKQVLECPDASDSFSSSLSGCTSNYHFRCRDNSSCIHNSLVCDGHYQCQDRSDEHPIYNCTSCPLDEGFGHPPRPGTDSWANNFPCLHRYTKLPICAISCNGRDDLCQDFIDEQNCSEMSLWQTLLCVLAVVMMMAVFLRVFKGKITSWCKMQSANPSAGDGVEGGVEMNVLDGQREGGNAPGSKMVLGPQSVLSRVDGSNCPVDIQENCRQYYEEKKDSYGGDVLATDEHIFEKQGTCKRTKTLYSNVDNSFSVRLRKWFAPKFPGIWIWLHSTCATISVLYAVFLASLFSYYLDIFKDTALIVKIYPFLKDQHEWLPFGMISVATTSLILGQLANIMTILNFEGWNWVRKVFASVFVVLTPAVLGYRIYIIKSALKREKGTHEKCKRMKLQLENYQLLRKKLRANENAVEHLPQLVIIILLILVQNSRTSTIPPHLSSNFLADEDWFLYTSATLSFFSLVRGQFGLAKAEKKGFIPTLGWVILPAYFAICTAARLFAFMVFYAPSFGLMDMLYHRKMGLIGATNSIKCNEHEDIYTWSCEWNTKYKFEIETIDQFYGFPKVLIGCIPPIMVMAHITLSHLFRGQIFFKGIVETNRNRMNIIVEGLYTIVCPPVHFDWELIYHHFGGKWGITSVKACWKRSCKLMLAFHLLHLLEHIILLVPLMALKTAIEGRNRNLEDNFFPPTADEKYSTQVVDSVLFWSISGFPLVTISSIFLLYMYFTKAHPWSRILIKKVNFPCIN